MTQLEDALAEELRRVLGLRLREIAWDMDDQHFVHVLFTMEDGRWRPGETLKEAYERWKFHLAEYRSRKKEKWL